jgi:hypothetical protein
MAKTDKELRELGAQLMRNSGLGSGAAGSGLGSGAAGSGLGSGAAGSGLSGLGGGEKKELLKSLSPIPQATLDYGTGRGRGSGAAGSGLGSGAAGSGLGADEKKKLLAASIGGPLSPAIMDSGSAPTPDKTFFDNLNPYAVLGEPNIPSKFTLGGENTSAPALKTEPDKESLFGSPMGARSESSLSGSVGGLGAPARALGTKSGAMRTEARRLRKQGYGDAAQKMALDASMARLNEPKILTQTQRGEQAKQDQESGMAIQEAAAAQAEESKYLRDLYRRGRADLANK